MNRDDLKKALEDFNVQAFLRVIREGESSQGDEAYRMQNGGKVFPEYQLEHPSKGLKSPPGRAFGAYQFLASTWAGLCKLYGFSDMNPETQDEAAVALIHGRGALDEVVEGKFQDACYLLNREWTSLPGGPEQNRKTAHALDTYIKYGGKLYSQFDPDTLDTEYYGPQEEPMPAPLVPIAIAAAQAFLPRLAELIPSLGSIFGSGSEVQKRNVAAATLLADTVTRTMGEPNLQAAMEKIERDPEKLAEVRRVVDDLIPALTEAGGGGIKGARDAAAGQSGDWRKLVFSLPFFGMIVFTPTIWAVVAGAVFKFPWLLEMDSQLRGTVIGFVMGTIAGGIVMYVYGASMTKSVATTK